MSFTAFGYVGRQIDNATQAFVSDNAGAIIGAITPIAVTGVGIYLAVFGYMVIAGRIQAPFSDFMLKSVKIILIAAVALNASNYTNWVVGSINGLQDGLASTFGHGTSGEANSTYSMLDQQVDAAWSKVLECMVQADKAGTFPPNLGAWFGWMAAAAIIAVSVFVLVVVGGVIIISATLLLKVVLAVGPLFLMCLLWPVTAKFFDSWFGQALTYVLKIVLVAVVVSLAMAIFGNFVQGIQTTDRGATLEMSLATLLIAVVLYKTMLEVGGVASGLAGGVSAAAMSIGQALNTAATVTGVNAASRFLGRTSSRTDHVTGREVVGSRAEHLLGGRTMVNPAYRQATLNRMRENWRSPGGDVKKS